MSKSPPSFPYPPPKPPPAYPNTLKRLPLFAHADVSSTHHSRKVVNTEDIITDPDSISDKDLHRLSQRDLSKRLPLTTSTRATFSVYLRWLEVHRTGPSARTEHWSNTLMHWAQSLASRRFSAEEVVDEVERWKRENGRLIINAKPYRSPPTEGEIRKAFDDDPKTHPERKTEKMGDSYRPESRREREREWRLESCDQDRVLRGERRVVEQSWRDRRAAEELWKEIPKDRKHIDKTKFDGPPPSNYICNRCGEKGHHLQVCPTNLDPSYDQPPDGSYECEICYKRGDHFKSLCPKNSDPYSIIQKRKARGIATTPKGGNPRREDWGRESKAQRDRESDRHERRSWGRLTEPSSTSSARDTPPSSKKLELLESLQDINDRKKRLFREQSDDIGDMIRESTVQRISDRKRDRPHSEVTSIDSPAANTIQARKKARMAESEHTSPNSNLSEQHERNESPHTQCSYAKDREQDTDMNGYEDSNSLEADYRPQSAPPTAFTLRPIGMSPGSMISDGSSDEMEIDELFSKPPKEYSPFVQNFVRKRPEMNEVVNVVKRRKIAREMWTEADQLQKQQTTSTLRTTLDSPEHGGEYGRLSPITHDKVMTMQFDGACDDFDYKQEQAQKMTSPEEYDLTKTPPHFTTSINSIFQTPHQASYQTSFQNRNQKMETPTDSMPDSKPETPTTSAARAVHFPQREERDVASAFKGFAAQQRKNVEAVQRARARNDPAITLQALKEFSTNFRLTTPVPRDLVNILSKDPQKQKEIQAMARGNAKDLSSGVENGTARPGSAATTPSPGQVRENT
ncbi:hypothetical protein BKA65DRAFT_542512 [Rhexocercosporidium sp. MPI-PUGE-AT-0058]|nr:hypothetical protein BKA65DRAFT_542512 [Rhexocercosporidium sp. MPI-PUGE-AT-0058]